MTYKSDCTLPDELLDQIADQGLDALPELIRTIINAAMHFERQNHLGVGPYERSPERRDYANGYNGKTVKSRVGELQLAEIIGVLTSEAEKLLKRWHQKAAFQHNM